MMSIKKSLLLFFMALLGVVAFGLTDSSKASALSASDWQAGRIIDDSVFYNTQTMGAQDIQTFLNSKLSSCDTNGALSSPAYHYNSSTGEVGNSSDPTVVTTRAVYGQRYATWYNAHPYAGYITNQSVAPYTCVKDYSQSVPTTGGDSYCGTINGASMSAATIIKAVSVACNINPQVLLVTLQKEQGLLTDDWPWANEYQQAMGFGCPDSSACDTQYYGFFNQVYHAARQFQVYAKNPSLFNYAPNQTDFVAYNPDSSCSGTNVFIQNQATADLYNYTPYQPNSAALNNLNGSGDNCSAYGNRNFWVYFWNWFGSPIGPDYSWSVQNLTYSGGDNNLTVNYPETLTVYALNTGRYPWYNYGANPVRLATWQPMNRPSVLFGGGSGHINLTNANNANSSGVAPGQVGIFTFTFNPPSAGTIVEPLNLVVENNQWMQWPGFSPTINITSSPYQWRVDSLTYGSGTGVMNPGTSQSILVKATNTGNTTWSKTVSPVWLATWPPDRNSSVADTTGGKWPKLTRVTQANDDNVAPGQQTAFQFNVRMPSSGNFYEQLNLVAEGQSWFNNQGLTLYLHGKTYAWKPEWSAYSTGGDANLPRGTTMTVTVKALNTGEMTWTNSGSFPIRLGTSNPMNRGTILYDTSWIQDTRPATLQEGSVATGGEGTFVFKANIPSTAVTGPRYEYFTMLAEGVAWFNDPGFYLYMNIK